MTIKLVIESLLLGFSVFILLFLLGAFIAGSFDFQNWDKGAKFGMSVITAASFCLPGFIKSLK